MKKFITIGAIVAALAVTATFASAETVESGELYAEITAAEEDIVPISEEGDLGGDVTVEATAESEGDAADVENNTDTTVVDTAAELDTEATDKGSPDTGLGSAACVAGLALLAGGVLVLSSKHNK